MRQSEARPGARERPVGSVPVRHHDAAVLSEYLARRFLRAGVEDLVADRLFRPDAPGPPLLRRSCLHQPPPRFIGMHELGGENAIEKRSGARSEKTGYRLGLVPERLRVDLQPFPRHDPHLAFERDVVEVLRRYHLDGELRCVAASGLQLRWTQRRLNTPVAAAAVLRAAVLDKDEAPLHDGDLFGFLELPHLLERPAASAADPVRLVELVDFLKGGKLRLFFGTVAALRKSRCGLLGVGMGALL